MGLRLVNGRATEMDKSYHFTVVMRHSVLECCYDAREVGDKLPKPEHLRLHKVVDSVKCSYSTCERLVTLKLWAVHQAVESITD